jgi:hypothetical protein
VLTGDKAPLKERDPNLLLRLELAESLRWSVSAIFWLLFSPLVGPCDVLRSHLRARDFPVVAVVEEAVNVPSVSSVGVGFIGTGAASTIDGLAGFVNLEVEHSSRSGSRSKLFSKDDATRSPEGVTGRVVSAGT